jgi:hypothetical protein
VAKQTNTTVKKPRAKKNTPALNTNEVTQNQQAGFMGMFLNDELGISPNASIPTYRNMRKNPVVALARSIVFAPLRLAKWTIEADDDVNDNVVEFIQKQIEYIYPNFIKYILYAYDYGFQTFEKVWGVDVVDGAQRIVYKKLKPLNGQITKIVIDKQTGAFLGLRQNDNTLNLDNSFLYTYDGEPGNYYGRSRHENIRESAWFLSQELDIKTRNYLKKISSIIPILRYPQGLSKDAQGKEESNFKIAQAILQQLGESGGIAMPQKFEKWADSLMQKGMDIEKLSSWQLDFLETKGQHTTGLVNLMKYYDANILRGWLVPERAAIEGQFGTKAEAAEHANLIVANAEYDYKDMVLNANWHLINPLLRYNFGEDLENKVRMVQASSDEDEKNFLRGIIEKVLTSNTTMFQTWVDINALFDVTGIPKASETLEPVELVNPFEGLAEESGAPEKETKASDLNEDETKKVEKAMKASLYGSTND